MARYPRVEIEGGSMTLRWYPAARCFVVEWASPRPGEVRHAPSALRCLFGGEAANLARRCGAPASVIKMLAASAVA